MKGAFSITEIENPKAVRLAWYVTLQMTEAAGRAAQKPIGILVSEADRARLARWTGQTGPIHSGMGESRLVLGILFR